MSPQSCSTHPLSSQLHPSKGTRLQSPSMGYTDVGKMSAIFPFCKMSEFLDMFESWASGSGRGSMECSRRLLWQVPCPVAWLSLPCPVVPHFLKCCIFSVSSNCPCAVAYSSGDFSLKIYPYFKHLSTLCFQNCTFWQEIPHNKFPFTSQVLTENW